MTNPARFIFAVALFLIVLRLGAATPVEQRPFGKLADGRAVTLYTLTSSRGLVVEVMDYGATLVSIRTPDRTGKIGDVALGFSDVGGYVRSSAYFGSVVGRVANRIADARFTLDGKPHVLAANNSPGGVPCSLHGGNVGFDKVLWKAEPCEVAGRPALRLSYLSKDGEEGYPGNLQVHVTYSLTPDHGLRIDYEATTDRATPVNLSNHSYFNLKEEGAGDILGHELTIHARRYTPVNQGLIPTGEIAPVAATPFDFTTPRRIGERLGEAHAQLKLGGGYDHNWVLDRKGAGLELAATVYEPASGRVLEVFTTEPGLQFYCGNFLDGSFRGKAGTPYVYRGAIVLEPQHFPDSVNQPAFPSILLRPGKRYASSTVFRFSTR
ncbi:aldose epimerase family protein [Oleiharenicola lentus]|uniref:aldose epimerase family protein n=1 Tax=Oleiharenicola lentus TaxID=2508720 RepID=UPI003F6640D6